MTAAALIGAVLVATLGAARWLRGRGALAAAVALEVLVWLVLLALVAGEAIRERRRRR